MQKAKAAVSDFMSKSGHHDTTVHETVSPSVQKETVKPHQHENVTTAVDKESHQDHYHRTIQPVHDREILPEEHHHNLGKVQHKQFDHRDHEGTKTRLATEQAGFKDEQVIHDTTHTQEAAPTVSGEHVHHHIHETIQPVVHKETVQPHVMHTTVPIHETHHHAAKHHESSELAPVSMADFKSKGGVLGGREERYDGFEGEPRNIGGTLAGLGKGGKRDSHHTGESTGLGHQHGQHAEHTQRTHGQQGLGVGQGMHQGQAGANPLDGKHEHRHVPGTTTGAGVGPEAGMPGSRTSGNNNLTSPTSTTSTTGHSGTEASKLTSATGGARREPGVASTGTGFGAGLGSGTTGTNLQQNSSGSKPGLLQKLNPLRDSDGDGKKGIMD